MGRHPFREELSGIRSGLPEACRFCRAPVSAQGAEVCDRPACRTRLDVDRAGVVGREHQAREAEARARARARALPILQQEARRLGWSDLDAVAHGPVPHLDRELVPLPETRKAAFLGHLNGVVDRAFDRADAEPPTTAATFARRLREVPDDPPALAATCMACRGYCCLRGALTHAFLTPESISFYRHLHPEASAGEVKDAYASRLPEQSIEGSCVYHGARGCVLPRTMRAEICNRWQCSDRLDLGRHLNTVGSETSLVVAIPRAEQGPDADEGMRPRTVAVLASGRIVERVHGGAPDRDVQVQVADGPAAV